MEEDLLDRYFAGKCSTEEAAQVKKWLSQPVSREGELLDKSWKHIQMHSTGRFVRSGGTWWRYAAAACIVCGLGFALVQVALFKPVAVTNKSASHAAFNADGVRFNLPPSGAVRVDRGLFSTTADLAFCGNARILNASAADIDVELRTTCSGSEGKNYRMTCKKGKQYLAMQYHFKSDEIIVVEEARIFDLPLPLQRQAYEALEI